jgi:hypothetical protein
VIFLEESLRRRDYRSLAAEAEERALGCGRDENGQFIDKNLCQADGVGGGGGAAAPSRPSRDDSWKQLDKPASWTKEQLSRATPIDGGEKLKSLDVREAATVMDAMSTLGLPDLDTVVAIGGGLTREAKVEVSPYDENQLTVAVSIPVAPESESSPRATWHVTVQDEGRGPYVEYGGFYTDREVSDPSAEGGATRASRLRVASVMREKFLESMVAAERAGITRAVMQAGGDSEDPDLQGYRLWPQFGFDGDVPNIGSIPDEIALAAAGIPIPKEGSSRIPRATVLRGLRQQVKKLRIQQLISTREGKRWWDKYGEDVSLTFDFSDKQSLGYRQFTEEQKKLPALRRRNEGRSWYPIDDFERRSCDGSDKDESGQFAAGNDCGGQGGGSSPRPLSRAKREQWRKSEENSVTFGKSEATPLIGGERVHELTIQQPERVAKALDKIGIKDLDTAVKIGGGAIRDSDIVVKSFGTETVSIRISSPIDPEDPDSSSVMTSVDVWDYGAGQREVHYGGLSTPPRISDPARLESGARDKTRLRIASLMQERMIESLAAAQKAGIDVASTYAAGDKDDGMYQGYRLWPQFGFDAKLDLNQYPVPAEIILAAFKKKAPESASEAAKQAKKLTVKGFTLQQLISTREGKKWWDDNGSSLDMRIDLKDRKSLGYKRLAKLKRILPKLKDRNVAEGRSFLGWLIEEVSRRSMSLVGFFGGLSQAIEQRSDCGPSDKDEKGQFTEGNDCQEGAGEGGEKPPATGVSWKPGQSTGGVTSRARENPPTVRSEDGKEIVSTTIPDAHIYDFAGRQWVATVDAGAKLAAEQDAIRGGRIDTGKKVISGPESEYILASITEQARSAMDRGIEPKFYSPEEREEQLAAFSEMIPQVRGGRTKTGVMVEQEDAEHLFRVIQAITSPNASPFINMQRTDSLLQKFFGGDGMVTTSDSLGVTGEGIRKSLRRFQKIVDTLGKRTDGSIDTAAGLRAARELLQGRSMRAGDIEKFFADFASKSDAKGVWKPGSYLVDEVVPVFSTFGPKVGPFYGNNNGDLDPLTADVWFSRTWGRVTGELVIPGSPTKSAKQATELSKIIGKASDDQLHGVSAAELSEAVKQTSETGAVSDVLRAWAGARLRHYARGDYKEKTGLGGQLNRLAKNIVENDTSLIGDPGSGSRRSHMIRLMREASRQTGVPVAYLQDILWQDEQDAYGALGAKTATNVGEPSLYSDQIRRLAANSGENRKPRARADRGYRRDYEQPEPFVDDYERGGREQMLWDAALAHLSDEEFANAVIKLAEKARPTEEFREERRNFAALDAVIEFRADAPAPKKDQITGSDKNAKGSAANKSGDIELKESTITALKDKAKEHNAAMKKRGKPRWTRVRVSALKAVFRRGAGAFSASHRPGMARDQWAMARVNAFLTLASRGRPENAKYVGDNDLLHGDHPKHSQKRSADCGRDEGGKFGPKNQCQEDGNAGGAYPGSAKEATSQQSSDADDWSELVEDGLDVEYEDISSAVFEYTQNLNISGITRALESDRYPEYKADLDRMLGLKFPDGNIPVTRVDKYAGRGRSGESAFASVSVIPTWGSGAPPKSVQKFVVSIDDVLLAGNAAEGELIVKSSSVPRRQSRRSADCGRDEGGKFDGGNTCAGAGSKGEALSNSKGESFRGVRRKGDKTQTKVARKLYQMRVPEKNLKGLVRDLGGKVSNTFVEINSSKGEEGVNVFVRDRDNNETHYIHVGYYGATVYTTDRVSSQEVSRIQAAAKAAMPQAIDDRLWGRGSDYPVYVVNSPDETSKQWDGLSAKQRLKKERRSADCGRDEGGKFGPKNQCQEDAGQGGSSLFSDRSNKSWTPASGDEPFEGASRYSDISTSDGERIAKSLDKMGIDPGEAIAATGAPERSEVIMRTAPEFAASEAFAGGESPPIFMDFTADVAGVRRGLAGSSVLGSRKNEATGEQEKVLYHNVFEVLPAVQQDAGKRHAAARAFYRTMVSSIENARKSGIAEITFSAAGRADDAADDKPAFKGYTIWPRMGFDAKLPDRIRAKLPDSLSHATSLLDLHATREGTQWWANNGSDIDVSLRLGDRSSPQNKIIDRFIKHFMKERREMPLGTGDDWLSPEDLLRLDEMWQEVWDEGDLDDYEYNDGNP